MEQRQKDFVAVDDSGDAGLKDGSSAYFSVAAIVFNDVLEAESASLQIKKFRRSLGWPDEREFKFNKMNRDLRIRFIETVITLDFKVYALFLDKSRIDLTKIPSDWDTLYNQAILELLLRIPLHNAIIRIDGRSGKKYMRRMEGYYRRELNKDKHRVDSVRFVDSKHSILIQLADVAAGSVNRSLQKEKPDSRDYIGLLKEKAEAIEEFRIR
ncbi:MAG: DUF3800 domain-containing protein [Coriobacteriales bacterium]|jgi:hypothetical protein|nr:DUF3800 domain-containing protein [Coriobacteriales bacterium]